MYPLSKIVPSFLVNDNGRAMRKNEERKKLSMELNSEPAVKFSFYFFKYKKIVQKKKFEIEFFS